MTAIGKLRHRLRIDYPVDTDDGSGGTTRTWATLATVWARIEPLSASERVEADRIEAAVRHRVTLRHRGDLTHAMRFVSGTRILKIDGIRDSGERDSFLVCDCEEITS